MKRDSMSNLDETEKELEAENYVPPPDHKIETLRHKGGLLLHSKQVLMLVVILNLADCSLVLSELILDIHYIKELREETREISQYFIDRMEYQYPERLHDHNVDYIETLYSHLYEAECTWSDTNTDAEALTDATANATDDARRRKRALGDEVNNTGTTDNPRDKYVDSNEVHHEDHSILEDIAHAFHKASIAILGVLVFYSMLKLTCMGKKFFTHKLEVFDSFVVIVSFTADLVLLKGMMEFRVEKAVFILSFLLPWRVIRVANSLVVAVLDHAHFRLKMMYKKKKVVESALRELQDMEKQWALHLQRIEQFCESEGIPKWKIRRHTEMGRASSTLNHMAFMALNGAVQVMALDKSGRNEMDKHMERSFSVDSNNSNSSGGGNTLISMSPNGVDSKTTSLDSGINSLSMSLNGGSNNDSSSTNTGNSLPSNGINSNDSIPSNNNTSTNGGENISSRSNNNSPTTTSNSGSNYRTSINVGSNTNVSTNGNTQYSMVNEGFQGDDVVKA